MSNHCGSMKHNFMYVFVYWIPVYKKYSKSLLKMKLKDRSISKSMHCFVVMYLFHELAQDPNISYCGCSFKRNTTFEIS